jgi:hypothetical protein
MWRANQMLAQLYRGKELDTEKIAIYDYKAKRADVIPHEPVKEPVIDVEIVKDAFGVQNVLANMKMGKTAVLLAGNSGLPGGAVGLNMKIKGDIAVKSLQDKSYGTQEEDVVKGWLMTEYNVIGKKIEDNMDLIWDKYGMMDFSSTDTRTRQGVNYTNLKLSQPILIKTLKLIGHPLEKLYADALVVRNALLSPKLSRKPDKYNYSEAVSTTLVFVAGPNVGAKGSGDKRSTTLRTFNEALSEDYEKFRNAVKWTYYAALHAMAMEGRDVALLCWVSGDLYAGPFSHIYGVKSDGSELKKIITEVLNMKCIIKGNTSTLSNCFTKVVVVGLAI